MLLASIGTSASTSIEERLARPTATPQGEGATLSHAEGLLVSMARMVGGRCKSKG